MLRLPALSARMGLIPMLLVPFLAGCHAVPQERERTAPRYVAQNFSPRPDDRACLANLGATRANFTPLPDMYFGAGCSAINAVQLSTLPGDASALGVTNLGPVTCPLANSFANWARFGVDRAARQILGSPIKRIETMGSYSCRNVAGTERRSAHANSAAIDVSGFVLADGRRITILGNWTQGSPQEREFLSVIHQSACRRFGTVLGPAYNAAHANHLHVELSGRAFCR